jgi:hypothetical protein
VEELQFQPTITDPDVYGRCNQKPSGEEYWELLLVYVDDTILIISREAKKHLKKLGTFYKFNLSSIDPPTQYLGANVSKVTIPGDLSGCKYWAISSRLYVQNAVKNMKEMLQPNGCLKAQAKTPFMSGYQLELNVTNTLDLELSSRYSQLIGILRWMVKLSCIDIYHDVSILSQYLALP